jgi:hypothetical protein
VQSGTQQSPRLYIPLLCTSELVAMKCSKTATAVMPQNTRHQKCCVLVIISTLPDRHIAASSCTVRNSTGHFIDVYNIIRSTRSFVVANIVELLSAEAKHAGQLAIIIPYEFLNCLICSTLMVCLSSV